LSRYCKQVIIAYDSDEAGKLATNKAIKLLNEVSVGVKVLSITGGKDPDEYIRTYGVEKFKLLLNGSGNYIEHKINQLKLKFNLDLPDEAVSFLKESAVILSEIRNPAEREIYINKISKDLKIEKNSFVIEVERYRKQIYKKQEKQMLKAQADKLISKNDKINSERGTNLKGARAEERLIGIFFANKDYLNKILQQINIETDFVTEFNKSIMLALVNRVKNNLEIELINLSGELSSNQMSKLSEIIANNVKLGNGDINEALELIEVIKKEKNQVKSKDTREMTNEEFLESIKKLKK
ncbi:MAG: toprim domain-containing protein, partial [Clostridia bacterium]